MQNVSKNFKTLHDLGWKNAAVAQLQAQTPIGLLVLHPDELSDFDKLQTSPPGSKARDKLVGQRTEELRERVRQTLGGQPFHHRDLVEFATTSNAYSFTDAHVSPFDGHPLETRRILKPAANALIMLDPLAMSDPTTDLSLATGIHARHIKPPQGTINVHQLALDHEFGHVKLREKAGTTYLELHDELKADNNMLKAAEARRNAAEATYGRNWRLLNILTRPISHLSATYFNGLSLASKHQPPHPQRELAATLELKEAAFHLAMGKPYSPPKGQNDLRAYIDARLHGPSHRKLRDFYDDLEGAPALAVVASTQQLGKSGFMLPETAELNTLCAVAARHSFQLEAPAPQNSKQRYMSAQP